MRSIDLRRQFSLDSTRADIFHDPDDGNERTRDVTLAYSPACYVCQGLSGPKPLRKRFSNHRDRDLILLGKETAGFQGTATCSKVTRGGVPKPSGRSLQYDALEICIVRIKDRLRAGL